MATVIRGDDNFDTNVNGRVLGVTTHTNNTRSSISGSGTFPIASFTVNKLSSTSTLVIQGSISAKSASSGYGTQGWKFGSGSEVTAQNIIYTAEIYGITLSTTATISGHTTTGSQTMVFRYFNANGATSIPFQILNPNATDHAQFNQTASVFSVMEVEA